MGKTVGDKEVLKTPEDEGCGRMKRREERKEIQEGEEDATDGARPWRMRPG